MLTNWSGSSASPRTGSTALFESTGDNAEPISWAFLTRPNEPGFSFPSGKTFSPPHPAIVRSVPVHPTLSRSPSLVFLTLSHYFEEIRHLTVSAHFLIERDGAITQFVSCHDRAWHAGVSCFDGREACNDFSLGIELEGTDTEPYTDAQYTALAGLTRLLRAAFPGITPERIQGHCDIAPERKTDPGEAFDWSRYRAGLTDSKEET
ncbi:1,6-anhydro-N-acetylmuramyl-L-alanine amidase AmpD [Pseudomonas aeruginosa]|uniref:1,6-anhydro-N-acetylmuramyl-L-alanine amidase AmpD n=1 Tax=Pseudomonas aeruginosa TaxID=287 RepID=UPI00217539A4|nr:1,6-anhydro-N-acetylmuramyl-L-alanine amidase AmpD [Pseudomonas aeruginosa]